MFHLTVSLHPSPMLSFPSEAGSPEREDEVGMGRRAARHTVGSVGRIPVDSDECPGIW